MVPDTETPIRVIFLHSLEINHFLLRDRDENIKCKAYFAEYWAVRMCLFHYK